MGSAAADSRRGAGLGSSSARAVPWARSEERRTGSRDALYTHGLHHARGIPAARSGAARESAWAGRGLRSPAPRISDCPPTPTRGCGPASRLVSNAHMGSCSSIASRPEVRVRRAARAGVPRVCRRVPACRRRAGTMGQGRVSSCV